MKAGDLVAHRAGYHWGGIVTAVISPNRDTTLVCVQWVHNRRPRLYMPHELEIVNESR